MLHLMHANKCLSRGIMKDWMSPEPSATWTKGEPQALSKEQFLQSPPETKDVSTLFRPHRKKGQNCVLWLISPQAFASLADTSNNPYSFFKPLF